MRSRGSKHSVGMKFISAVAMSAMGVSLIGHVSAAETGIRALRGALASGEVPESERGPDVPAGVVGEGNNRTVPDSYRGQYPLLHYPVSAANPAGGVKPREVVDEQPSFLPEDEKQVALEPNRDDEVVELRSEYRSTFRNPDGSLTTELSSRPLNYKDEQNSWQRIVPKLVQESAGKWTSQGDSVNSTVEKESNTGKLRALVELKPGLKVGLGTVAAGETAAAGKQENNAQDGEATAPVESNPKQDPAPVQQSVQEETVAPASWQTKKIVPSDTPTQPAKKETPKGPAPAEPTPGESTKPASPEPSATGVEPTDDAPKLEESSTPEPSAPVATSETGPQVTPAPTPDAPDAAPSTSEPAPMPSDSPSEGPEGRAESESAKFQPLPGGLEQTVEFTKQPSGTTAAVPLTLQGLKAVQPGENVTFLDDNGTAIGSMSAATFMDQRGAVAHGKLRLDNTGEAPQLAVVLPTEWLGAETTAYPVKMSLSVTDVKSSTAVTISKNYAVPADKELQVGNKWGTPFAGYVGFPGVKQKMGGHRILGVRLAIADYQALTCKPHTISVHKVNQAWSASDGGLRLPGPAYDRSPLGSVTTSHGYIAPEQRHSKCPLKTATSIDLGGRGRDLVQSWAYGQPNHGLTLRADESNQRSGKTIAGTSTKNPPRLYITHSPYHAEYEVAGSFNPPILQNKPGRLPIRVVNRSALEWQKDQFYLAYSAHDKEGKTVAQGRAADLPETVHVGKQAELMAEVGALREGPYTLSFTMMRKGGESFVKHGVPPLRLAIEVFNTPPVFNRINPANGAQVNSLTPQLWARATDLDAPPSGLQYEFHVCELVDGKHERNCFGSGWQSYHVWKVPADKLHWNKTYRWNSAVKDSNGAVTWSPKSHLMTQVAQPTARPAAVGTSQLPFDSGNGAVHSSALDVKLAGPYGGLSVMRSYNSGDARRKNAFGRGWVSNLDVKLKQESDGAVVVTLANGVQARFGRNPDGSYTSPSDKTLSLKFEGNDGWTMRNNQGQRFWFNSGGRLTQLHPAIGKPTKFRYYGQGDNITQMDDEASGRTIFMEWHDNLVRSVIVKADGGERRWKYDYHGDKLHAVVGPDGQRTVYDWVEEGQYGQVVLADRPESYWRLNDKVGDSILSSTGANLGRDNAKRVGIWVDKPGIPGGGSNRAMDFDGTEDRAHLPEGILNSADQMSVELWYRPNQVTTYQPLLSYQEGNFDNPGGKGAPILYVGWDGHLYGRFAGNGNNYAKSSKQVTRDWQHFVLTAVGDRQKLFINGELVGETQGTIEHDKLKSAMLGAANSTIDVPQGQRGKGYAFGRMDEVAVYVRALSHDTIKEHFQAGSTKTHLLHRVTTPSGRTSVEAHYDSSSGRVSRVTDSNGGQWTVSAPSYHGNDKDLRKTVQVTGPGQRQWFYEFDGLNDRMLRQGSPSGKGIRAEDRPQPIEREAQGDDCSKRDPKDPDFCLEVGSAASPDKLVTMPFKLMAIKSFHYPNETTTRVIDENGHPTEIVRNERGNSVEVKTCRDKDERDCSIHYTVYGEGFSDPLDPRWNLPIKTLDARSKNKWDERFATKREYTEWGALKTTISPNGERSTTEFTKDWTDAFGGGKTPAGLPHVIVDEIGRKTTMEYDRFGNLRKLSEASGVVTEYEYNDLGQRVLQRVRASEPNTTVETRFVYDSSGQLIEELGPKTRDEVTGKEHQIKTTIRRDSEGRPVETRMDDIVGDTPDRVTSQGYDAHGRVAWTRDSLGNQTTFEFDSSGNQVAVVDALGNRIEYTHTARDEVAEVRAVGAPGTSDNERYKTLRKMTYDYAGQLRFVTDGMGRTVETQYNLDGTVARRIRLGESGRNEHNVVTDEIHYDKAGNVTRHIGKAGKEITDRVYDYGGRLVSTVMDPDGLRREEKTEYHHGGNVRKVSVAQKWSHVPGRSHGEDNVVEFEYDHLGRKTREIVKAPGTHDRVTSWTYDSRGLVTSAVSARGNAPGANPDDHRTKFFYDALGRMTRTELPKRTVQDPGGSPQDRHPVVKLGYNAFGETVVTEDAAGHRKTTERNALGQATKVHLPYYHSPIGDKMVPQISTKYDALGRVTEVRDAGGRVSRKEYDSLGRLVKTVSPAHNGQLADHHFRYNLAGDLTETEGPDGQKVRYAYDDAGRQTSTTVFERHPVQASLVSKNFYNKHDQLVKTRSPGGSEKNYSYDSLGQLISVKDNFDVGRHFGYDNQGRQSYERDDVWNETWKSFTNDGRLVYTEDKDRHGKVWRTSHFDYDEAGNMVSSRTGDGRETKFEWDAAGALTKQREKVRDDHWIETSFGYDIRGKRTRYTDGRGNSTFYSYNSLGMIEKIAEPKTAMHAAERDRTWIWSYDGGGLLKNFQKPGGVSQDFGYDEAGQVTWVRAYGGGLPEAKKEFGYDKSGRLKWSRGVGGNDHFSYNDRGQLLTSNGVGGSSAFEFNEDGLLRKRHDAAGMAEFQWDRGRLRSMLDPISRKTLGYEYDQRGLVRQVNYPGGQVRHYGYDALDRLTSDRLKKGDHTVAAMEYGYDGDSNVISRRSEGLGPVSGEEFHYDLASRLTLWKKDGVDTSYEWDDSGNRTRAGGERATYDERNRLLTMGGTRFEYSPRGTMKNRVSDHGRKDYEFDAFDRLTKQDGWETAEYDSLDRMVSLNGKKSQFAGMSMDPVAVGERFYGRDVTGEAISSRSDGAERLLFTNGHGDVVGALDPHSMPNQLNDKRSYDPFGRVASSEGVNAGIGFQADVTSTAGNVNMGARWYDPSIGGFLSRDTAQYTAGASILANRYTYGAGNPVTMVDPDGHWPDWRGIGRGLKRAGNAALSWVNHTIVQPAARMYNQAVSYGNDFISWASSKLSAAKAFVTKKISSGARWAKRQVSKGIRQIKRGWRATKRGAVHLRNKIRSGRARAAAKYRQQRAEAARRAKVARQVAHRKAKQAQAFAARNNPLPVVMEMTKPLVSAGLQTVLTVGALPEQLWEKSKPLVSDAAQKTQALVDAVADVSGSVARDMADGAKSAGQFLNDNRGMVVGIVAGVGLAAGCAAAGVATAGLAAVACLAAAGAISGALASGIDCPPGQSRAACAGKGALAGAITGVIPGGGSVAGGVLAKVAGGALLGAAGTVVDEQIQTGSVSRAGVVSGLALGAVTAGRARRVSKPSHGGAASACGNSFTGGTGVVMADGSSRPIRDVRVGDMVRTVDEESGRDRGAVREVVSTRSKRGVHKVVVLSLAVVASGAAVTPAAAETAGSASTQVSGVSVARDSGDRAPGAKQSDAAKKPGEPSVKRPAGSGAVKRVVLEPTANHPFFVVDGDRWVDAGELAVGDRVALAGGGVARVESSVVESRFVRVHNLTVDRDHTFLVTQASKAAGAGGVKPKAGGVNPSTAVAVHNSNKLCGVTGYSASLPMGGTYAALRGAAHRAFNKFSSEAWEVHHMPASSAWKGSKYQNSPRHGPAIVMTRADHRLTASHGASMNAREYREDQQALLDSGDLAGAIQMDVDDIRRKFGSKYDRAISEMYAALPDDINSYLID